MDVANSSANYRETVLIRVLAIGLIAIEQLVETESSVISFFFGKFSFASQFRRIQRGYLSSISRFADNLLTLDVRRAFTNFCNYLHYPFTGSRRTFSPVKYCGNFNDIATPLFVSMRVANFNDPAGAPNYPRSSRVLQLYISASLYPGLSLKYDSR